MKSFFYQTKHLGCQIWVGRVIACKLKKDFSMDVSDCYAHMYNISEYFSAHSDDDKEEWEREDIWNARKKWS